MMYAVNLADMTGNDLNRRMVAMLVAPVVGEMVHIDRQRIDAVAVILNCEEERAQAIVEVIRLKLRKHELRCYKKNGKGWKSV